MRIRTTWIATAAVAAVTLALATAGNVAQAQTPTATASPLAACPTSNQLIVAPPTAAAPTTVTTSIAPALGNLKAATQQDRESLHLHYFVDTPPPAAGTTIPTGVSSIIHTAALTQDVGPLAPGVHTVYVVVGQLDHRACALRAQVTFTVGGAAATKAAAPSAVTPPKTGSGGLLGSTEAASWLGMAAVAAAVVGVAGGAVVARRRR